MSRLRSFLSERPLLTAVLYTGQGILPLFLVSAQILQLEADLGFRVASIGLAAAAFYGVSALVANPAGTAIKRFGPRTGLRVGATFTVGAGLVAAAAQFAWMIPLATGLAGVGNALIQVAANVAIFDGVSSARQGLAFGAKQASVPLAGLLAGISLPVIGLLFGWRWGFVGAALIATAFALSAPEPKTRESVRRQEDPMGRPPKSLLVLVIGGFFAAAAGNSISLFIVPSAVNVGIAEGTAGFLLAACSSLVVAVRLAAGWTVDRRTSWGHLEMLALVGLGAAAAITLSTTSSAVAYLSLMPVALLGLWGWPGVFFFTVVTSYPRFPARASGLVLSVNLTGTVLGPLITGALAGAGRYSLSWLIVGGAGVVSAAAFFSSHRLVAEEVRSVA